MEKRLRFERLGVALRERAWPDSRRAESLAAEARELAATILRKCALDSTRMTALQREGRMARLSSITSMLRFGRKYSPTLACGDRRAVAVEDAARE